MDTLGDLSGKICSSLLESATANSRGLQWPKGIQAEEPLTTTQEALIKHQASLTCKQWLRMKITDPILDLPSHTSRIKLTCLQFKSKNRSNKSSASANRNNFTTQNSSSLEDIQARVQYLQQTTMQQQAFQLTVNSKLSMEAQATTYIISPTFKMTKAFTLPTLRFNSKPTTLSLSKEGLELSFIDYPFN